MAEELHARFVASLTELKRDPIATVASGNGQPVAILNRGNVAFYCVPSAVFEDMKKQIALRHPSPSL